MEKIRLYDLMEEIILKVSSKVNKKALREVLENFDDWDDLNYILINYYNRVHRVKNDNLVDMVYLEDFENEEEFITEIKNLYNAKIYKNKYDYENGGKIAQKNTGLVLIYDNGFRTWSSWAFDVYKYLVAKGLEVEVFI